MEDFYNNPASRTWAKHKGVLPLSQEALILSDIFHAHVGEPHPLRNTLEELDALTDKARQRAKDKAEIQKRMRLRKFNRQRKARNTDSDTTKGDKEV